MMKTKGFAALCIAVTLCLAMLLTACAAKEENTIEEQFDRIYGFETQEEINSIKAYWDFGKMQASKDSKYISEGGASMRLEVLGTQPDYHFVFGDWFSIDDQYLLMYLRDNDYSQIASTDWTGYEGIVFDAYNPGKKDVAITMFLTTTVLNYVDKSSAVVEVEKDIPLGSQIVTKGGGKNTLKFDFPVEAVYNGLDNVKYLKFVFANHVKGQEPTVVYIDDLKAQKCEKPEYTKGYETDEIAFFESDIDSKLFTTTFDACQYKSGLKYSVNNEAELSSQGVRSLLIERPASPRDYEYRGNLTAHMSTSYLKGIDFKKYNKATTLIAVDLLSVSSVVESVSFGINADTVTLKKSAALIPFVWTTVYIPMADNKGDWSNVYDITFNMGEHFDEASRLLYIDNIRFVTE